MKRPTGARSEALGGAAAALVDGADALFRNPAGMARLALEDPQELAASYSALVESTYAGSLAYAKPGFAGGVLGVGVVYFSQTAQTAYNVFGDATGSFAPYDAGLTAAYARRSERLLYGGGVKLLRSDIDGVSGMTAAVDAGLQALHVTELGEGPLDLGATLRNVGPPIKVGAEASPLPMELRGGGLWHANETISAALDLVLPVDADPYVSLGVEAGLRAKGWAGFLRAGFDASRARGIDGLTGLSAGGGLDVGRMRVDYAWVPFGDLGMTNRLALIFRF